ncbi:MAG: hypothetical protein ACKO0Z_06915 [Betaproteobacteria bacterium]
MSRKLWFTSVNDKGEYFADYTTRDGHRWTFHAAELSASTVELVIRDPHREIVLNEIFDTATQALDAANNFCDNRFQ